MRRGNTRLIAVILGAESPADRSREIRRLVEAGFQSRAKGISVASALSKQKNVQYAQKKPKKVTTAQQARAKSKPKVKAARKTPKTTIQAARKEDRKG